MCVYKCIHLFSLNLFPKSSDLFFTLDLLNTNAPYPGQVKTCHCRKLHPAVPHPPPTEREKKTNMHFIQG